MLVSVVQALRRLRSARWGLYRDPEHGDSIFHFLFPYLGPRLQGPSERPLSFTLHGNVGGKSGGCQSERARSTSDAARRQDRATGGCSPSEWSLLSRKLSYGRGSPVSTEERRAGGVRHHPNAGLGLQTHSSRRRSGFRRVAVSLDTRLPVPFERRHASRGEIGILVVGWEHCVTN